MKAIRGRNPGLWAERDMEMVLGRVFAQDNTLSRVRDVRRTSEETVLHPHGCMLKYMENGRSDLIHIAS